MGSEEFQYEERPGREGINLYMIFNCRIPGRDS